MARYPDRALQITVTTQAVIGKTRGDGCSEAVSHPERAAYHRSHHVAMSVTMTLTGPLETGDWLPKFVQRPAIGEISPRELIKMLETILNGLATQGIQWTLRSDS